MQTVLVVEDEKLIRQGISAMIKRCAVPVGEIIECANGLKALEVLKEKTVDVMFTDIRMPKMNGIELVKALQEIDNPPITIAVSGYDDFSYAVEMMRQGVREYILKPVERDKLKEVMEKLEQELDNRHNQEKTTKEFGNKFLKYVLTDEEENEENLRMLDERIKSEVGDEFYVLVTCGEDDIHKELKGLSPIAGIGENEVFILGKDIVEAIRRDYLDDENGYISTAGLSDEYTDVINLKKAYRQARERRGKAFFRGSLILDEEGIHRTPKNLLENGKKLCDKTAISARVQLMGTDKRSQIEKEWSGFFTAAQRGQIHEDYFEEAIVLFAGEFEKVYKKTFDINLTKPFGYNSVYEFKEAFMEEIFLENSRLTEDCRENLSDKKMILAVDYIKENYQTDINMAVVSNYVSMNYTLFSTAFKNFTGTNFVSYVRELRIEEAKRLLSNTTLRINEIGTMVGYDNDKHFLKNFKAQVGVSPGEYRKNVR